jgi:vacuolar-type H+-ATPase subunit E/Vma4
MKERNVCLEKVKADAKQELMSKLTKPSNPQYQQTLKKLIIQGMIKMLEPEIFIKCREADADLIKGMVDDARN